MSDRTYLVTAKFKLTGDIDSMVEREHIRRNLLDKLQSLEVVLSGEYYGDIDEEWTMWVDEGLVELQLDHFEIAYIPRPSCEHCGEGHKDFGVEIRCGDTSWCLDCYDANEDVSDEERETILAEEKKKRKAYLKKQLEDLEKE